MISNLKVAKILEDNLNEIGKSKECEFRIFAGTGKYKASDERIQGVLNVNEGEIKPVEGYVNILYKASLEFPLSSMYGNSFVDDVNGILLDLTSTLNGKEQALDSGRATFVFSSPSIGNLQTRPVVGESVILSLNFTINYTENGVSAKQKVWLLDGVVLPYLNESVDLEKTGEVKNVFGDKSTQSLPTKQTKYFGFTLPYKTDNAACVQLQKDILSGDMQKIYTLSYYDGVAYTENEPFTAKVTLFRTGKSGAQMPSNSEFSIWFTEADDPSKSRIKYEMALIDNQFDYNNVNTRWFNSQLEQQTWFENKISASNAPFKALKAPNINSLMNTQQIYFAPPNIDLNSLLSKNYAVIKSTEGETTKYYYYFILSSQVGSDNQIICDLKLDTIQTYRFDPNINIPPCLIRRAHLNRFIDNGDGTVSFDGTPESPLFEQEDLRNLAKILKTRKKINLNSSENSEIDSWVKENIYGWLYVYVQTNNLTGNRGSGNDEMAKKIKYNYGDNDGITSHYFLAPYAVFCAPILKKDCSIKIGKHNGVAYHYWDTVRLIKDRKSVV